MSFADTPMSVSLCLTHRTGRPRRVEISLIQTESRESKDSKSVGMRNILIFEALTDTDRGYNFLG